MYVQNDKNCYVYNYILSSYRLITLQLAILFIIYIIEIVNVLYENLFCGCSSRVVHS